MTITHTRRTQVQFQITHVLCMEKVNKAVEGKREYIHIGYNEFGANGRFKLLFNKKIKGTGLSME